MDLIERLPISKGKVMVLVVVDRLNKYEHFMAISHPYTTTTVAQDFLDTVYRFHGLPKAIVSNQDPTFTSHF